MMLTTSSAARKESVILSTVMKISPENMGLHSSTFQLNVSAFCGIGGASRDCLGVILRVFRRCRGVLGDVGGCVGGCWGVLGV